jgi:hypothetical protein
MVNVTKVVDVALKAAERSDGVWWGYVVAAVMAIRGAQTAFILFSTFLELRPVLAAHDVQTSINSRLESRISKSKTPV